MQQFVRTLSAALAVDEDPVEDGIVLILDAVRGAVVAEDWQSLVRSIPQALDLLDFDRRRARSSSIIGPPPQTAEEFDLAVRDLGLGAYRADLLIRFTTRFLAERLGETWWFRAQSRIPALAGCGPEERTTELPMASYVEDLERPPLLVPDAWERGELPAWLRA